MSKDTKDLIKSLLKEREELIEALEKIAKWEMPETGRTWDDGTPMSYAALYGSNGERDHIKSIANELLNRLGRV